MDKFESTRNEPRVGQTVIKTWLPLVEDMSDIYPEGFKAVVPWDTSPPKPTPPKPPIPIHLRYPGHPPPYSHGRIPELGEAPYWGYVDWAPDTVLLGCNTKTFPPPPAPKGSPIEIFSDGYWGSMEYTLYPRAVRSTRALVDVHPDQAPSLSHSSLSRSSSQRLAASHA